ncbi:MAG TPA: terminase TerL endonuclease subunit [Solirubrobacterales bacterium]|nr:terminase TerL endonuclease subunit [Solirubrobacterales bacterium]
MDFKPGLRGFYAFARVVGADLKPFQRRIARAHFGAEREAVAILPRGSLKSTTAALIAVHHVLTVDDPGVYIGAASREQARVIGSMVRALSRHRAVRDRLVWRTDALRWAHDPKGPAVLQVVSASGDKAHGWPRPTLILADEIWAWSDREPTLLGAMLTAMLKNPECRFLGISTSAARLDSPLGSMQVRAMASPEVERVGVVLEAGGDGLRWLEWSLPDDADAEDLRLVAAANPLRTVEEMREQRKRVSEVEWLQFHCCRWGVGTGHFLPPGAWAGCLGDVDADGEPVWLGVDIGGSRAASAVVGVTADLKVAEVHVFQGDEAVLAVTERVLEIADRRPVVELAFDPWRYQAEALRLERDHGLTVVQFPQSHSRMIAASENLHRVIVEGKLTHPGDPHLDRHVAAAVARKTGRGWRIDKLGKEEQIDAVVALAMACERAEVRPEPVKLLGWV